MGTQDQMKLVIKIATLAAFLLTTVAVGDSFAQSKKEKRGRLVGVDEVRMEAMVQTMAVIGRLVSVQTGVVASRIEGAVAEIKVDVGVRVKKGDVLAILVSDRFEWERELKSAEVGENKAKLANTMAQLALARQGLRRLERLRKSVAFPQARYEDKKLDVTRYISTVNEAKAKLKRAQANLKLAELDLKYSKIRAPYDGVVTIRHTIAGAFLKEGQKVVTLVNDARIEVEADVPSSRIGGLIPGVTVRMRLEDQTWHTAKVRAVVPDENTRTRTRVVRFVPRFNGTTMRLATNQTAILQLPIGAERQVVTVHKDALISSRGNPTVFVVVKRRVQARRIRIGESVGGRFEVLSGLEPGEVVVVRGNERLRDGRRIRIERKD